VERLGHHAVAQIVFECSHLIRGFIGGLARLRAWLVLSDNDEGEVAWCCSSLTLLEAAVVVVIIIE